MDFTFETLYDQRALTAIARAVRKIYRRRSSFLMRLFGLLVVALGVYNSSPLSGNEFSFTVRSMISYAALFMILVSVLFEDSVNGLIARSKLPRGDYVVDSHFEDDVITLQSSARVNSCQYQRINHLAETRHYFLFVFDEHHAEIFEKDTLAGITEEEFRVFIKNKTGKEFQKI